MLTCLLLLHLSSAVQHNVRLSLTYLDVEKGEGFGPAVTAKTEALIKSAMQPVKQYT
jgi:hypothetical protein